MNANDHWLARPRTIRGLVALGTLVLAASVAAQWWVPIHGYFGLDGLFAFHAVYGFVACVAMVWLAKLLGVLLKRRDDYYRDD